MERTFTVLPHDMMSAAAKAKREAAEIAATQAESLDEAHVAAVFAAIHAALFEDFKNKRLKIVEITIEVNPAITE